MAFSKLTQKAPNYFQLSQKLGYFAGILQDEIPFKIVFNSVDDGNVVTVRLKMSEEAEVKDWLELFSIRSKTK